MVGFMKSALSLLGIKRDGGSSVEGAANLDEFLKALPRYLGYDIQFKETSSSETQRSFEVVGDEADSFLGDNCEMLDALAHIGMRVFRRAKGRSNEPAAEGEAFRVTFDASGFRDKMATELKDLATELRQRVLDSGGKPSYVKSLSPSERKIIHTHLAELGEVVSESIGRGTFKRIRIKLKDDSTFGKPQAEMAPDSANANGTGGGGYRGPRSDGGSAGGGSGGGRSRGGRGRGGIGGGRGRGRGRGQGGENYGNRSDGYEPNGNVAPDLDARYEDIDDNVGNRLKPGEAQGYPFVPTPGESSGDKK